MNSNMKVRVGGGSERRVTMTLKLQQVLPPLSDEGSGCNTDPSPSSGSAVNQPKDKNSIVIN